MARPADDSGTSVLSFDPSDSEANNTPVGVVATTIEDIYEQIMGEQPGVAEALRQQWHQFSEHVGWIAVHVETASSMNLYGWESPAAKAAYLSRQSEAMEYMREVAAASATISGSLFALAQAMREGQQEMEELWAEYQTTMAAWDAARARDRENESRNHGPNYFPRSREYAQVERDSRVGEVGGYADRAAFKELWDAEARRVQGQINTLYAPPVGRLGTTVIDRKSVV